MSTIPSTSTDRMEAPSCPYLVAITGFGLRRTAPRIDAVVGLPVAAVSQ